MASPTPIQVEICTPSTARFDLEHDQLRPDGVAKRTGSIQEENKDLEPAVPRVAVLEEEERPSEYLDGGYGWAIVASKSPPLHHHPPAFVPLTAAQARSSSPFTSSDTSTHGASSKRTSSPAASPHPNYSAS